MDLDKRFRLTTLVLLSVLIHTFLLFLFQKIPSAIHQNPIALRNSVSVKINMVPPAADSKNTASKTLETNLKETKRPEKADYLGLVDHAAQRQTRIDTSSR